jgi:site-specific DNA-methyltransferase (cytosine-N4-specific)
MATKASRYFLQTKLGKIFHGDSYQFMTELPSNSVDLIITSPPFGLTRKKEYGNVPADEYVEWFIPYARQFHRLLKRSGSLVIDIGGTWNKGIPTKHLYHFKLLIMLCDSVSFHLAQDFYWYNPAKLPSPAEWVNIRRIRVKDAINHIWWLSKSEWPKASNERVKQPYGDSMNKLMQSGYNTGIRPSGHNIGVNFGKNNGGSIPPNLIALANTGSNDPYHRYCRDNGLNVHPARYPREIPEFFIRMLTDSGDLVFDPFAGSCATGEVCERLKRNWICSELREDYLKGAKGRFLSSTNETVQRFSPTTYQVHKPGAFWNENQQKPLHDDGGKSHRRAPRTTKPKPKK